MARCSPRDRASRIPKNIPSPIAITGNMVNSEARLKLRGISPRMAERSGPTAAMLGRRFNATSTTLAINQKA
ncbi:hypothetical protein PSCICJ_25130 [Pseudomonas cichorii]|nr:hypothetical protein PSCICJ_25130 [Pseudomonas cichorii]